MRKAIVNTDGTVEIVSLNKVEIEEMSRVEADEIKRNLLIEKQALLERYSQDLQQQVLWGAKRDDFVQKQELCFNLHNEIRVLQGKELLERNKQIGGKV